MRRGILAAATVALLLVSGSSAWAGVVTFSGLSNFNNYSEDGMNMTSTSVWNWPGNQMAHMDSGVASFSLASGNNFDLDNVEMINSGGTGPARFTALLNGVVVGTVDVAGNAGIFNFDSTFENIDEFQVTVPGSHFTYDNINFSDPGAAVPEPASVVMLGLGGIGIGLASWRRRRLAAA